MISLVLLRLLYLANTPAKLVSIESLVQIGNRDAIGMSRAGVDEFPSTQVDAAVIDVSAVGCIEKEYIATLNLIALQFFTCFGLSQGRAGNSDAVVCEYIVDKARAVEMIGSCLGGLIAVSKFAFGQSDNLFGEIGSLCCV